MNESRLRKLQHQRLAFLSKLFDATGGDRDVIVDVWEIGEALELSSEQTSSVFQYLDGEGLLQIRGMGGLVSMTHKGVRAVEEMASQERSVPEPTEPTTEVIVPDAKKVFIIHGRNLKARHEVGVFIRSLGLTPINFGDLRAKMGGTPTVADIVEEGMQDAQGVIALITADEYSALRPDLRKDHDQPDDIARWQARPNVIFEAGMAFGRDRKRVVFVLLGNPKLFTDVSGIHVLRPNNAPSGDRVLLRNVLLQGMQCAGELHSTDWMTSGDFEGCIQPPPEVGPRDPF